MMEFDDLTIDEKGEMYNKAFTFIHDHSDHVHSLFNRKTSRVAPSGSDMFHPELWKGIHWAWFIWDEPFKD